MDRVLLGYNTWGFKESDMTEHAHIAIFLDFTSMCWDSLVAQLVKKSPAMQETSV